MRPLLTSISYGLYTFLLLGLAFHTSSEPSILGKYSPRYAGLLALVAFGFLPWRWATRFFLAHSWIESGSGSPIVLHWSPKVLFSPLFVAAVAFGAEAYLRLTEREQRGDRLNSYHPYLQNQITPSDKDLHVCSGSATWIGDTMIPKGREEKQSMGRRERPRRSQRHGAPRSRVDARGLRVEDLAGRQLELEFFEADEMLVDESRPQFGRGQKEMVSALDESHFASVPRSSHRRCDVRRIFGIDQRVDRRAAFDARVVGARRVLWLSSNENRRRLE